MPKLFIVEHGNESVYEIFEDEVSLGRGAANSVQVTDEHASKMHAVIRRLEDHFKLIDLESRNGTRVNGQFRNQHWLSEGDTITVGSAVVRYAAEGAPQGAPGGAAPAAARPQPVVAKPAAPVAAAPAVPAAAPAVPAPAVPAPVAPAPAAPAPVAAAPAAPAPVRGGAPVRAGAPASARRRRPARDDYDDYDDEYDDRPPPRRRSNSGPIVIIGILAAVAFVVVMFAMFGGGPSTNQEVYRIGEGLADKGEYEKALLYAEQHADPDGNHYSKIVRAVRDWKKKLESKKDLERNQEARKFYDYEIWRKQGIAEAFRAKDAETDEEIVRRLRELLTRYKGTQVAQELMHSEYSGFPDLREAMREHADPDLKGPAVFGAISGQLEVDLGAHRFGKAKMDLEYLRDMNRLCMTPENWNDLRQSVDQRIDEIVQQARTAFDSDKRQVEAHRRAEQRSQAWRKISQMQESYNGIPELMRQLKVIEDKMR